MLDLSLGQLGFLTAAAFVAGTIDAIGGGGGLVTLPALAAVGLPPHLAIGTNKGQAISGAITSLVSFWRAGLVDTKRAKITFPLGVMGALAGAWLLLRMSPEALKPIMLVMLTGVAILVAFRRFPSADYSQPPVSRAGLRAGLVALVIGAYDGFFGPGTGTLLIMGFVLFINSPLSRASADAKVVNLASNIAALTLFTLRGVVLWKVALPMMIGQTSGAFLGARLAVRGGDKTVRWVLLAVVLALVIKLGFDFFM